MSILKSYYLSILFMFLISALSVSILVLDKFSITLDTKLNQLKRYETYFDYNLLKSQLERLNAKAIEYKSTPQAKEDAILSFLMYADFLKKKHDIFAKTDRPIDTGDTLTLGLFFDVRFSSSKQFHEFLSSLSEMVHPIVKVEKLTLREDSDGYHTAIFDLKLIEPYIKEDK